MLAAALALSLAACGSGAGQNSATLKEEDAIEATPKEVYNDVKDNEARALQNVYKVTGEIAVIKSDYCSFKNANQELNKSLARAAAMRPKI